jgi:aminoglycoside phosphotransferase (APT) family kinase protein
MQAWAHDLTTPVWNGMPTWLHGDLAPDNLLLIDGKLSAVLDWAAWA